MVVFGELGTGQTNLVTMVYGDRWRVHRKVTHLGVGLQQVRSFREYDFQNPLMSWEGPELSRLPK
jgi:hypothetical protein